VTDLLIGTCGAWLGYQLARHAARVLAPDRQPRSGRRDDQGSGPGASPPRGRQPALRPPPRRAGARGIAAKASALLDWLAARPFSVGVAYLGAAGLVLILLIVLALRLFAP
jgi:hypothetical protein